MLLKKLKSYNLFLKLPNVNSALLKMNNKQKKSIRSFCFLNHVAQVRRFIADVEGCKF